MVAEFKDGTQRLYIYVQEDGRRGIFTAPANAPVLSVLDPSRVKYRRIMQGPDFGYSDLAPTKSLAIIGVLVVGAVVLGRWARCLAVPPSA